jgi:hypothetical protein
MEIAGGGVDFAAQSVFSWQFDGPTAGDGDGFHSLLSLIDGTATLESDGGLIPILDVDVLGQTFLPVVGQTYTAIDVVNPAISRVTGDFMSLSGSDLFEGATLFDYQGFQWQISYFGGTGNDVVLTSLSLGSIPQPGTLTLLGLGLVTLVTATAAKRRWRKG